MATWSEKIIVDDGLLLSHGLSQDSWDTLCDHYGVSNDSYHRYYPGDSWNYIKNEVKQEVNAALLAAGVPLPDVLERGVHHPDGYFQFHVIIHFSW